MIVIFLALVLSSGQALNLPPADIRMIFIIWFCLGAGSVLCYLLLSLFIDYFHEKQAEINKAIADRAYQTQMGMSVDEYIHMRQLEIEKEKVELIKDNKNVTIIFGGLQPTYPVK